jgi:hypothetical protein
VARKYLVDSNFSRVTLVPPGAPPAAVPPAGVPPAGVPPAAGSKTGVSK